MSSGARFEALIEWVMVATPDLRCIFPIQICPLNKVREDKQILLAMILNGIVMSVSSPLKGATLFT